MGFHYFKINDKVMPYHKQCKPNVSGWGNIIILGIPKLQVSIVLFKVVCFGVYTLGTLQKASLGASVS